MSGHPADSLGERSGAAGEPSSLAVPHRTLCSPDVVPQAFVRKLHYHMDSAPATNKSQYCFGGLGLLCATAILDAVNVSFMVVGHTKFDPDMVANKIAQKFNAGDSFNQAMLLQHTRDASTSQAYDGTLLKSWKDGTSTLFCPVQHIMTYRQFLMVADDGEVNFGPAVTLPAGMEPFTDSGPLYTVSAVDEAVTQLAKRTLLDRVLPAALSGKATGIGSEFGCKASTKSGEPVRLLPDVVSECRRVRLLTRRNHQEMVWREQRSWFKPRFKPANELILVKRQ